MWRLSICLTGVPEGQGRELAEVIFEEQFPELMKD